jgi:hypothetical protein
MQDAVWLDKPLVLRVLYLAEQAQLSVHRGIGAWAELRAFYDAERRQQLNRIVEQLPQPAPAPRAPRPPGPGGGPFRLAARWCANRWRSRWAVPYREAEFIATLFRDLLGLLARTEEPESARLVELRIDFHRAASLIRDRCAGAPELRRLSRGRVECLFGPTWVPVVPLADLTPPETKPASVSRAG